MVTQFKKSMIRKNGMMEIWNNVLFYHRILLLLFHRSTIPYFVSS